MPVELKILALGALLLFIHIFIATRFKTAQYGRKWNVSARDEALPEPNPVSGRLIRAQANFEETFPIAIVALLGVVVAGKTSRGRRSAAGSGSARGCICLWRHPVIDDRLDDRAVGWIDQAAARVSMLLRVTKAMSDASAFGADCANRENPRVAAE